MTNQAKPTKTLAAISELIADRFESNPSCVTWDDEVVDLYDGIVHVYSEVRLGSGALLTLAFHMPSETFEISDIKGMEVDGNRYDLGHISDEMVSGALEWAEMALSEDRQKEVEHMEHEKSLRLDH